MTESSDDDERPVLEVLLEKNQDATERVQKAADNLAVVHAVLSAEPHENIPPADVEQAVAQTARLEKKLTESVEVLGEVNNALAAEIKSGGNDAA